MPQIHKNVLKLSRNKALFPFFLTEMGNWGSVNQSFWIEEGADFHYTVGVSMQYCAIDAKICVSIFSIHAI